MSAGVGCGGDEVQEVVLIHKRLYGKKKKKKKNFSPVVWFSRSFFGVPTRPKIWVHLICFALRAGLNIFGALEGQPADDQ